MLKKIKITFYAMHFFVQLTVRRYSQISIKNQFLEKSNICSNWSLNKV